MIHFLKNLSVMGGLLYVAAHGAGRLSMHAGMDRPLPQTQTQALKKVVHQ